VSDNGDEVEAQPGVRSSMTGGDIVSGLLLVWCGAMAIAVAAPAPVDLRAPLVVAFACFAPGWALVRHLRLSSVLMELVAAIALSTSLLTLGSYLMVVTGHWAPYLLWEALTLLTAIDVSAGLLVRAAGRRRDGPPRHPAL
jgi:hypothetical protein